VDFSPLQADAQGVEDFAALRDGGRIVAMYGGEEQMSAFKR